MRRVPRMRPLLTSCVIAVMISIPFSLQAQTPPQQNSDFSFVDLLRKVQKEQFSIVDYKNLGLSVETVEKNDLGLSTDRIHTRVELKFREANLTPREVKPPTNGFLEVRVGVLGAAFQIRMEFRRPATWTLPNGEIVRGFATTWVDGTFGTHGKDISYVLDALDEIMDAFLNAYLR